MQLTWSKCDHKDMKKFCLLLFRQIRRYCNNPDSLLYRWYGGIGVKCLFTSALEIEYLYRRDHVEQMTESCLARKKFNGDFSHKNCFFWEQEADFDAETKRLYKEEEKKEQAWNKRQDKRNKRIKNELAKQRAKEKRKLRRQAKKELNQSIEGGEKHGKS